MTRLVPVLAASLALSAPALAGDLFVGPAGSGAAFQEIADAVAAALPGDTIHVAPGSYDVFSVDKPLRVLGAGSALVTVQDLDLVDPIVVDGVPAGSEVVLSGFTSLEAAFPGSATTQLEIRDSPGRVLLHDVHALPSPALGLSRTVVSVVDSPQVLLLDCRLVGESATSGAGGVPLSLDGSQAWIADSVLTAGDNAPTTSDPSVTDGPPALLLFVSDARISRSALRGGDGSVLIVGGFLYEGGGGHAVLCGACEVFLAGGPGNLLQGGDAAVAAGPVLGMGAGGSGVGFNLGGDVDYASDVVFLPGFDSLGVQASNIGEAVIAKTVVALPHARPTLAIDPSQVPIGQSLTLDLAGNPSGLQLVALAFAAGDALTFPGVDSPWVLSPFPVVGLGAVVLDGAGLGSLGLTIPPDPTLQGVLGLVQAAEVSAQIVGLSNPAGFVVD